MTDRSGTAAKGGVPDPLLGRLINDRFKVVSLIARGGMGKVYRAEQAPLGRLCALKVLNPNYAGEQDPEFHRRFFLEASIASKLTHPNTVTIFDYGRTDDDVYYMAMEYLEGVTLHKALRQGAPFDEERAAHIARQICRALREAHSLGVIHRDLKPANIFLTEHGDEKDFVKVLDFGLVKNVGENKGEDLTQTGLFMGSPKYMAPEQIRGDRVDARTDIYALGVILYEMLTGKVPFDRPNSVNILMAHMHEEVPPMRQMNPTIQLSQALEETVMRCMSKDANGRFSSMDEVLGALKRMSNGAFTGTMSGLMTGEYRVGGGHSPSVPPPSTQVMPGRPGAEPAAPVQPGLSTQASNGGADAPAVVSSKGTAVDIPSQTKRGALPWVMAAALIGGAVVVAVIAAQSIGRRQDAPPAKSVTTTPTTPITLNTAPSTIAAPSASAFVKIRVTSDPDGASVREDGVEVCSRTPCDVSYSGDAAKPETQHKIQVIKIGYKSETSTFGPNAGSISIKLTREFGRPQVPPPNNTKPEVPVVPPGYKPEVPY